MAGIGTFVYGKCFGVVKITGVIETQYLSFLVRESKCMPQGGIEGVCRVVLGGMQPDGWIYTKVTVTHRWAVKVTQSLKIIKVIVTQAVCPSMVIEFGNH